MPLVIGLLCLGRARRGVWLILFAPSNHAGGGGWSIFADWMLRLRKRRFASSTIAAGAAFTRALAQTGIIAWEGIGDVKGNPIEPNPTAIEPLLELWPAFEAIDRLYVGPALTRLDEKNV